MSKAKKAKKAHEYHVQCELRRDNGTVDVSWIPEKFAVVGRRVRLKNRKENTWEEGWTVVKAYPEGRRPTLVVEEEERLYLKQREESDV